MRYRTSARPGRWARRAYLPHRTGSAELELAVCGPKPVPLLSVSGRGASASSSVWLEQHGLELRSGALEHPEHPGERVIGVPQTADVREVPTRFHREQEALGDGRRPPLDGSRGAAVGRRSCDLDGPGSAAYCPEPPRGRQALGVEPPLPVAVLPPARADERSAALSAPAAHPPPTSTRRPPRRRAQDPFVRTRSSHHPRDPALPSCGPPRRGRGHAFRRSSISSSTRSCSIVEFSWVDASPVSTHRTHRPRVANARAAGRVTQMLFRDGSSARA